MRAMRGSVEEGMCGLMGVPERKKTHKVRRMISLNWGLWPMKEAAWSRASRVQVSMQEVEGGTLST